MTTDRAPPFESTSTVARRKDVLGSNIDGEIVLMSAEQQSYFGLNGVGSVIWRRLATPAPVDALYADIVAQFDGDPATIEYETCLFLELLLDRGLIVVTPPS